MQIKLMTEEHADIVKEMMRTFYASPCLLTDGSEEIFDNDIKNCINENPYLEGYVFVEDDNIVGYAMLAKSFSTEFGKPCIWIEDLYLIPRYRHRGVGSKFFAFTESKYPDALFRLEAERNNLSAIGVYKKNGFTELPYLEMKK